MVEQPSKHNLLSHVLKESQCQAGVDAPDSSSTFVEEDPSWGIRMAVRRRLPVKDKPPARRSLLLLKYHTKHWWKLSLALVIRPSLFLMLQLRVVREFLSLNLVQLQRLAAKIMWVCPPLPKKMLWTMAILRMMYHGDLHLLYNRTLASSIASQLKLYKPSTR